MDERAHLWAECNDQLTIWGCLYASQPDRVYFSETIEFELLIVCKVDRYMSRRFVRQIARHLFDYEPNCL